MNALSTLVEYIARPFRKAKQLPPRPEAQDLAGHYRMEKDSGRFLIINRKTENVLYSLDSYNEALRQLRILNRYFGRKVERPIQTERKRRYTPVANPAGR